MLAFGIKGINNIYYFTFIYLCTDYGLNKNRCWKLVIYYFLWSIYCLSIKRFIGRILSRHSQQKHFVGLCFLDIIFLFPIDMSYLAGIPLSKLNFHRVMSHVWVCEQFDAARCYHSRIQYVPELYVRVMLACDRNTVNNISSYVRQDKTFKAVPYNII